MKAAFFVLVLANVALFIWEYRQGAFRSHSSQQAETYGEPILLVKELQTIGSANGQGGNRVNQPNNPLIAEATESSSKTSEPAADIAEACVEAGPFLNYRDFLVWQRRLAGFFKAFTRNEPVVNDYLVYYPAAATLAESQANLRMLKDIGVRDIWLQSSGADLGQISFGVFDKEDKAIALKIELQAKTVNAQIKPRFLNKQQRYAYINLPPQISEMVDKLKVDYPEIKVKALGEGAAGQCEANPLE